MVITKLMGGLGNQMFQYATGYALSQHHQTELGVDISFLNQETGGQYTKRDFELNVFNTAITTVSKEELHTFLTTYYSRTNRFLNSSLPYVFKKHYFLEKGHQYHPDIFKTSTNVFLSGFWQSENYFSKYREQLLNIFTFKSDYLKGIDNELKLISNSNSVSLHVRRGDYIENKNANSFHGVCSLDYYEQALLYLENLNSEMEVFIFSDDIEWCKQNLKLKHGHHYVDNNSVYKDFFLMKNCKHNIIANSSYSWWAAWLNTNPSKMVIAPKKWNNTTFENTIVPDNWIKL